MPENWEIYRVSDFIEINPKVSLKQGVEYSFVEMKDLDANSKYALPSVFKELNGGSRFQNQDTLFARITPCLENGKICQVKNLENNLGFGSTEFLVFRGKSEISDTDFVYYLSRTPFFRKFAESKMIGTSGRQRVAKDAFANLELQLPYIEEQTAIASILSAIDDKIELNLQMNKTLEEMAMALYKHWFVDFGPFREGEYVDSELGRIPKGWEVKRLEDILEIKRGGSPRPIQDFLSEEGLPWMKISDATASNSPFLYTTKEYIKVEGLKKTILIKPGNIILSNSATPGLPRLIEFETCIHDGWLHFPHIKRFNRYILYLLFLNIKEHLIQQGNGSVFTNLKTDILKAQLVNLPPINVEINFTKQITPWFEEIRNNTIENQTLTTLRDTLLPKLISGEVRLNEFAQT